ncbi:hypothetical protein V5D56_11015 [Cellulosimicrobium sp. PMB13]|uniref:hypothetical protein n=1 Tax=Cellulosimicrobium sp. PMB13 TaxID=3120158 RepID=UPI003F4BCDB1
MAEQDDAPARGPHGAGTTTGTGAGTATGAEAGTEAGQDEQRSDELGVPTTPADATGRRDREWAQSLWLSFRRRDIGPRPRSARA